MKKLEDKGLKNVEGRVLIRYRVISPFRDHFLMKTYSERAQICFDLHVVVDGLEEGGREDGIEKRRVIGTTKKG